MVPLAGEPRDWYFSIAGAGPPELLTVKPFPKYHCPRLSTRNRLVNRPPAWRLSMLNLSAPPGLSEVSNPPRSNAHEGNMAFAGFPSAVSLEAIQRPFALGPLPPFECNALPVPRDRGNWIVA